MEDDDITAVPVFDRFDSKLPIGELRVRTASLPPTPEFAFGLAYTLDPSGKYTIKAVAMVPTALMRW